MIKAEKSIILPSGAKCKVRRLSESDFISANQTILFLNFTNQARKKTQPVEVSEEKAFESLVKITRVMLTNCCGKITYPDGTRVKIVDKDFDDCDENEIAIETLDQKDAAFIVNEVQALSGMTKEAATAAKTFPEGQADSGISSPAGDELRSASDSTSGTQPV